jgi:hypothetical protein
LVVELVQRGVGAGEEDEFVVMGEEVVRDCEADSWGGDVRMEMGDVSYLTTRREMESKCIVNRKL